MIIYLPIGTSAEAAIEIEKSLSDLGYDVSVTLTPYIEQVSLRVEAEPNLKDLPPGYLVRPIWDRIDEVQKYVIAWHWECSNEGQAYGVAGTEKGARTACWVHYGETPPYKNNSAEQIDVYDLAQKILYSRHRLHTMRTVLESEGYTFYVSVAGWILGIPKSPEQEHMDEIHTSSEAEAIAIGWNHYHRPKVEGLPYFRYQN